MNTSHGASNLFGHADYYANLSSGMSNQQILSWINGNRGQLHQNRYGAGELYQQISAAAGQERQREAALAANQAQQQAEINARAAQIAAMQSSFDSRMEAVNKQMFDQQQTYQTNLMDMKNSLTEQQKQFAASQNPSKRESVLGVKGAGVGNASQSAALSRQGTKGSFGREGLRIKSLNI
jgi:hypothetical protein